MTIHEQLTPSRAVRKSLKKSVWAVLLLLLCLVTLGVLIFNGIIWPNNLFVGNYSVRGIDVSSYQHHIDWQSVAKSGAYTFAYIKATEGAALQDDYFQANWRGAQESGLLRGAYHYFTVDQSGAAQANNFINMVPKETGMLPPMLDLEVTGKDHTTMLHEIKIFLERLTHYYGVTPLIYTDHERYAAYIQGNFANYPLTLRDVFTPIQWSAVSKWTIWQYCDRGHVTGIVGFVDLDAFYGRRDQLNTFANHS